MNELVGVHNDAVIDFGGLPCNFVSADSPPEYIHESNGRASERGDIV